MINLTRKFGFKIAYGEDKLVIAELAMAS